MKRILISCLFGFGVLAIQSAQAITLFDTVSTIEPKTHALGLEFPILFTDGEGLGYHGRYKYGVSDYANVQAVVGSSGKDTGMRLGTIGSYYLLPDLENQPGVTVFADFYLTRFLKNNQWIIRAGPMVHKEFLGETVSYNVFVGLPLGLVLRDGRYWNVASLSIGSTVRPSSWRHMKFVAELGIDLSRWHNYITVGFSLDFDTFSDIRFD